MVKVIATTDRAAFRAFMASPQGEPYRLLVRVLDETEVRAKDWADRLMERRTGNLLSSHVKTPVAVQGKKLVGGVENTAAYAMFVHEGTTSHPIVARRAKVLHWISPGKVPWAMGPVFVPAVTHPGTKPRPWLYNAAAEVGRRHGFVVTKG